MGIGARGSALYMDVRTICLALTGCATSLPHVAIRGDELADSSQATLAAVRIDEHGERGEDAETVFLYQTVTVNSATTTLEKALEGCGAFSSTHPCRVDARTRIVLREISQSMLAEEDAAAHATAHPDDGPHTNAYNPALAHVAHARRHCIAICEDDKEAKSVALGAGALPRRDREWRT